MKSRFFKTGFTLAEIMIVLMVIGIISAILLPIAHHATPDENILKFKKANATLGNVIRELVTSDKYYLDGDLGVKPDGEQIKSKVSYFGCGDEYQGDDESVKYFCNSIADLVNAKEVNCSTSSTSGNDLNTFVAITYDPNETREWFSTDEEAKKLLDEDCKESASKVGAEIVFADGTIFYQTNPNGTFGIVWDGCKITDILFKSAPNLSSYYKPVCLDIDGINQGEDPFGYGIRYDGKILYGQRAQEWMKKSIQGKD